jgi:hypothetical protein
MKTIILCACCLLLAGCATYERCADRYGVARADTVTVAREVRVAVAVPLPSDTVTLTVDCDSLADARAESRYLGAEATATGRVVRVSAYLRPAVLRDTVAYRDTVRVAAAYTALLKPAAWYEKLWEGYKNAAAVVVLLLGVVGVARVVKR